MPKKNNKGQTPKFPTAKDFSRGVPDASRAEDLPRGEPASPELLGMISEIATDAPIFAAISRRVSDSPSGLKKIIKLAVKAYADGDMARSASELHVDEGGSRRASESHVNLQRNLKTALDAHVVGGITRRMSDFSIRSPLGRLEEESGGGWKSKKLQKKINKMKTSLQSGLEHYQDGELEKAKEDFVQVLKPFLSKDVMKKIPWSNEDRVTSKLLKAMYHLGEIYAKDSESPEHYAKAAAIYQYCAAFAEKYDVKIGVATDGGGKQKMKAQEFLHKAYDVERAFLQEVGKVAKIDKDIKKSPKSPNKKAPKSKAAEQDDAVDEYYDAYAEKVAKQKAELEAIRGGIRSELKDISASGIGQIADRAAKVEDLYKRSSQFFVDHQERESRAAEDRSGGARAGKGFAQKLLEECYEQLGPIPAGCKYAIIGLGSIALGTLTPWSDFEFAILINKDRPEYREYFRNLTKLLHIKIINLGETPLRTVGVEALNNFKTADASDDWFWDNVLEKGFNFDGADWYACKNPLGRHGYRATKKVKNADGVEEVIIEDKPDYELIMTPEQMASLQLAPAMDENTGQLNVSFASDRHLIQALRSVSLIDGFQSLLNDYRKLIYERLDDEQREVVKSHALEILKEDIEKFSLKLGEAEEGKLLDVKKDIYRLGDRVLSALADYCGIRAAKGQPLLTVWEMLDALQEQGIFPPEVCRYSKQAISIAVELRLHTYSGNQGQIEVMATFQIPTEFLPAKAKSQLPEKIFPFTDTSILHKFYYVMLRMQEVIREFCRDEQRDIHQIILSIEGFFHVSNIVKGKVHARFMEYDRAVKCMEEENEAHPENLVVMRELYFLYRKTGAVTKAINIAREIINIKMRTGVAGFDIADSYNDLGIACKDAGHYDEAIEHFETALRMFRAVPGHRLDKAKVHNNLGVVYNVKGEFDLAIQHHKVALKIKKAVFKKLTDASVADSCNDLGSVYANQEKYNSALKQFKMARDGYREAHKHRPNHPDIAKSHSNLASAHSKKGEFDKAMKHHKIALSIYEVIYEFYRDHPDFAMAINNFAATLLQQGMIDEAIENFADALAMRERIHEQNPNHPDIAQSHNNLAKAYYQKGDQAQADEHYNVACTIYQEVLKDHPNHQQAVEMRYDLGKISYNIGKYKEALDYIDKALVVFARDRDRASKEKAINLKEKILVQLGAKALLDGDLDAAISYYEQMISYSEEEFGSEGFAQLQLRFIMLASKDGNLDAAINLQQVLLKVDPNLQYGNHYYNLASLYACHGEVAQANDTFLEALKHKPTSALYAKYAQFLIANKGYEMIPTIAISQYLYAALAGSNDGDDKVCYVAMEMDKVCGILAELIKHHGEIELCPDVLAYYLLIKNPEYIVTNRNLLIEELRQRCAGLDDPVSKALWSDIASSTRSPEAAEEIEVVAEDDDDETSVMSPEESVDDSTVGDEDSPLSGEFADYYASSFL
jgi:tetratricopeptide (TPR) repeat protein